MDTKSIPEEQSEVAPGLPEEVMEGPATEGALALKTADQAVTREQRRSRRKREVRARTISVKRMTKRELELGRHALSGRRGRRRSRRPAPSAPSGERPCPFVSCKHHLYLDVSARRRAPSS